MDPIKIIHFNVKSLRSSKDLLEHHLNFDNVDIAMISEHWLKPNELINIKNFKLITSCRRNGYGGVAFLIKNNINFKINTLKNYHPIETIEVETLNLTKNLVLVSIYIPSNSNIGPVKQQFKNLITDCNHKRNVLIAGDVNAHHSLWEHDSNIDRRGIVIADILNLSNFHLLNNGDHTFIKENGTTTAIDIAIAHIDIACDCLWEKTFENLNSDHFITQTLYRCKTINYQIDKPTAKINYKKLERDFESWNFDYIESIEEFQNEIETVTSINTTEIQPNNKYIPKYWWTEQIRRLWEIKRHKLKLYNRYKTLYTKIEYKKSLAKLKLEIKKSKKLNLMNLLNTLIQIQTSNLFTIKLIFSMTKKIKKMYITFQIMI